jgi:hypothetical protein
MERRKTISASFRGWAHTFKYSIKLNLVHVRYELMFVKGYVGQSLKS